MMNIPEELLNIIFSYRGQHPIAKLLVCSICGDDYNWGFLRIHEQNRLYTDYSKILCECCLDDIRRE
jgi:hypothetical protein